MLDNVYNIIYNFLSFSILPHMSIKYKSPKYRDSSEFRFFLIIITLSHREIQLTIVRFQNNYDIVFQNVGPSSYSKQF